jgi:hypothetical protein
VRVPHVFEQFLGACATYQPGFFSLFVLGLPEMRYSRTGTYGGDASN